MPHISIEYSANVEQWVDIGQLCEHLRVTAVGTGVFKLAGVRVRALRCDHYAIADGGKEHGFMDLSVRLRGGRSLSDRQAATHTLFDAAEHFLSDVIAQHPFALSLEMRDIDPELSPKLNTIRNFLNDPAA